MSHSETISVCICTYRRNELLERLLRNMAIQRTNGRFEYAVIVVDNDVGGRARETVERLQQELGLRVTYTVEPDRCIAAARNHALRLATGDFVAIMDDDEFPAVDWLSRLHDGIQTFAADGVLGPVYPVFHGPVPSWLVKSRLCESPVHRTGTLLHWSQTFTNNVLIRRDVFERHGIAFDLRFRTGGSDQEFFRQAMLLGCRFVAIAEAPVYEVIPPSRWTHKCWVKRAVVNGFNARKYARELSPAKQAFLTAKAAVGAAVYMVALPLSGCLGHHRFMMCLEKASYHFSRTCASFGVQLWKKRDF
jgi:glycosyltransferase involved in cell wall biosynthesis